MTGNVTEAEDLTQEVFVQLLRKIDTFRGESQFTTWLHRLTVNQVLMHFRRTRCQTEINDDVEKEMAKAGYEDAGEYVLSLIKQGRQKVRRDQIEEMLLEALDSPSSPMTKKDWDDIRRIGRRMIGQQKSK